MNFPVPVLGSVAYRAARRNAIALSGVWRTALRELRPLSAAHLADDTDASTASGVFESLCLEQLCLISMAPSSGTT